MGSAYPPMRSHFIRIGIVGLGLVAFACQSTLAAMFSVSSGSCTLSGDCIRTPNYPSYYPANGDCGFTTLAAGTVSTTAFNTESNFDKLIIGGTLYSGSTGPAGVSVTSGEQMSWDADHSQSSTGWELCLTPPPTVAPTVAPTFVGDTYSPSNTPSAAPSIAPTSTPTVAPTTIMSTTGTCTLSTSGDCVSSPNYPSPYTETDCTITNNQAGYLTAGTFNTESGSDVLHIRRRGIHGGYSGRMETNYANSKILNVYLGAGEQ